jgi:hypothetical protein
MINDRCCGWCLAVLSLIIGPFACSSSDSPGSAISDASGEPSNDTVRDASKPEVSSAQETGSTSPGSCAAWQKNFETQCPALGEQSGIGIGCASLASEASDLGCEAQWNAYLACESTGTVDCKAEDVAACSAPLTALKSCQSRDVKTTPCVRVQGADQLCDPALPNAWGCLGSAMRQGCIPARDTGSSAAYYCCP